MPPLVTAATGIDAMSHALETYVTKPRNAISNLFSRNAWRLLANGFRRVIEEPGDVAARAQMLLGAHLAGGAIENSMLGATHALANPLSAHFNVTHGIAIGVMLPHVIRYNAEAVCDLYGDFAAEAGLCSADDPHAPAKLASFVESLLVEAGCPNNLGAAGADLRWCRCWPKRRPPSGRPVSIQGLSIGRNSKSFTELPSTSRRGQPDVAFRNSIRLPFLVRSISLR